MKRTEKQKQRKATKRQSLPQIKVINLKGEKMKAISVAAVAFGLKPNDLLLSQVVNAYLANKRLTVAKTKSRGEVRGSTRKIWAQKGTGRARHGDRQAPIFVGGGVAHGPKGNQNFSKKINKKMKRKAVLLALSDKLRQEKLLIVKGLEKIAPKAKNAQVFINTLKKIAGIASNKGSILLVLEKTRENITRAFSNLSGKGIKVRRVDQISAYDLLGADLIALQPKTVEYFESLVKKVCKKEK
jgi:large subunit ribosomal protein L4